MKKNTNLNNLDEELFVDTIKFVGIAHKKDLERKLIY